MTTENTQATFINTQRIRFLSALVVVAAWLFARPCLCAQSDASVVFYDCRFLRDGNVQRLLQIEMPGDPPFEIRSITVSCFRHRKVSVHLVAVTGFSVRRMLYLNEYDTDERERVLALSIAEMVREAREWETHQLTVKAQSPRLAPSGKAHGTLFGGKRRWKDNGRALRSLGAAVAWQHMARMDALGPEVGFIRAYPVGLGWQISSSLLFGRDDTSAGTVKTMIASAGILPFMSWNHKRFVWRLGMGGRMGMVQMEGVPAQNSSMAGNALSGVFGGPLVMVDAALVLHRLHLSLGLELGYSFAAVLGHAPDKDIAVDARWIRPTFFSGFKF
ncbi:MAG: hypothetical protein JXR76_32805 [Deltaproteobacteria bacterium]|nr:hypothetical protein [Deltaproteobacteria bacterium]